MNVTRQTRSGKSHPKAAPRRKAVPVFKRPLVRFGLTSAACAALVGLAAWSWTSGLVSTAIDTVEQRVVTLSAQAGFTVRDVLVTGRREASRAELRQALGLRRGMPLLTFDPERARKRINALPWVAAAAVERRLPDIVYVTVTERTPMALWQTGGKFVLIDDMGAVIDDADVSRFAQLPLVVGADAPKHARRMIDLLAHHDTLAARVKAAIRVSARRWTLTLIGGIDIHLPAEGAAAALARLDSYQREYDVLSRDISVIDLRVPGRLVVRRRGETAPSRPIDNKDTRGA